jgi:hypothetical protein
MVPLQDDQKGIVKSKEGEPVILLPPGPIRTTVKGQTGEYVQVLVDDPLLGRPTARVIPEGDIFVHP